ncbi:hypothetical protein ACFX13_030614 [Malus domestica]
MKDGRHMLSGEGGTASSPRFKSKRRSEGPDIFKVLKEEEIGQIKILEVQEGSFHKRKFKCALKRTACLYKKSALDEISEIEEASSEFEEAIQKSKRQAQKSEKHLAFPDASAPVTRKLSFAEITGNLSKRRSQISKRSILLFQTRRHPSHANSALRKSRAICRSADPRYRRGASLFQPRHHLSYAHSTLRKSRAICRRFSVKEKARESLLFNHVLVADTSERIVPLQVLRDLL